MIPVISPDNSERLAKLSVGRPRSWLDAIKTNPTVYFGKFLRPPTVISKNINLFSVRLSVVENFIKLSPTRLNRYFFIGNPENGAPKHLNTTIVDVTNWREIDSGAVSINVLLTSFCRYNFNLRINYFVPVHFWT